MDWIGCNLVEVDSERLSGVPVIRHSRVQADTVLESHELGQSVEQIAYSYDLDADDVIGILTYAAAHSLATPFA